MKCDNCGAPLPNAKPGSHGNCEYCGLAWHVPANVEVTRRTPEPDPSSSSWVPVVFFGVLTLVILGVVGTIVSTIPGPAADSVATSLLAQSKVFTKAELVSAPPKTWFHIAQDELVGDLEHFDAADNYAWANAWARAWAPDARLDYFFVNHIAVDGRPIDVVHDDKATYDIRFVSPTLLEAAKKMSEVSEEEVPTGIRLWAADGKLRAMLTVVSPRRLDSTLERHEGPPAPETLGCSLADVMSAAAASGKMEKHPFYDIRMWELRGHWVWSVPDTYIDVTDCSVR